MHFMNIRKVLGKYLAYNYNSIKFSCITFSVSYRTFISESVQKFKVYIFCLYFEKQFVF